MATQPFNYTIWAQAKPRKAPATRTGKPKVTCSYQRWWYAHGLQKVGREYADPDRPLSTEPVKKGAWYEVKCSNGSRKIVWIENKRAPAVIAEQLAHRAYKRIPIAAPRVLTAPPRGRDGLVGLPHWFYLAEGQWTARTKRLRTSGVWAEATARPQRMAIDTGEGHTITCNGPGTAYDPSRPVARQSSTCSYRFQRPANARRVTVSVTWGGTWRGSGGAGGALPAITRSVTFPVRIVEAQALVTKG
ncbi:hypothetical protein FE391_00700 [Nonomuraea sp. KC401]|uniref:hypothetical protein n=1 Tax=unclassified Nonomuraea TaxID=2593643 RepID=UPI0010FE0A6F|nr:MULTISPECIES: hypothetical protein [unclassified Nonomuraea]NBE91855.1 hypothetical protein [Nonomuraea sp. K271]TLF86448.1 hypothetical protein FE391_00700 [Nonomuraea sp. KC401]